ncbi:hypothetical protein ABPG72_017395 [Tetrahymena utriculariae]
MILVQLLLLLYNLAFQHTQQQQYDFLYQLNQRSSEILKDHQFNIYQLKSSLSYTIIIFGQYGLWWIDNRSLILISQSQIRKENEQLDLQWLFIADQLIGVTILNLNYVEQSNGIISTFQMNKCASVGGLYFVDQVEATLDNKYLYAFDRWYGIQILDLTP